MRKAQLILNKLQLSSSGTKRCPIIFKARSMSFLCHEEWFFQIFFKVFQKVPFSCIVIKMHFIKILTKTTAMFIKTDILPRRIVPWSVADTLHVPYSINLVQCNKYEDLHENIENAKIILIINTCVILKNEIINLSNYHFFLVKV